MGLLPGGSGHRHRHDDEVGEEQAVRVQVPSRDCRALVPAHDDDRSIGGDRWQRCSAAVEDHEIGGELGRHSGALEHVRHEDGAGKPSPAPPATHRLHAGERGRLEVIGRSVPAGARESDERVDGRRHRDGLRFGWPSPSHRDDDDMARGRQRPRHVSRHCRLADALSGADHRDRGKIEGQESRWVEAEVRSDVRDTVREHTACKREALDRAEHGLVGEVDDDLWSITLERRLDVVFKGYAVALAPSQLLDSADEHGGDEVVRELDERVADDGRVVLAVHEGESSHVLAVISSSMAPVNFAYSSVSSEKETSLTSPWNGWRRQMSTLRSATSMTL